MQPGGDCQTEYETETEGETGRQPYHETLTDTSSSLSGGQAR
jgi:hypothetical protein